MACDLDNTFCVLGVALRREAKRMFEIDLPHDSAYDLERYGISRADADKIFTDGSVFREVDVRPQAVETLTRLRESGYKVMFVTDRFWYEAIGADTKDWFQRHEVPYDELALVRSEEKANFIKESGKRVELFFEDRLDIAQALAPVVPVVYLFDFPWNRAQTAANVVRVSDWEEWVEKYGSAHV